MVDLGFYNYYLLQIWFTYAKISGVTELNGKDNLD